MSVDLIVEDARWKTLNILQIANAAFKETLSHLDMRSENFICCILACSSKKIKVLNAQFRGKNNSTNVLSFPSTPEISRLKSPVLDGADSFYRRLEATVLLLWRQTENHHRWSFHSNALLKQILPKNQFQPA